MEQLVGEYERVVNREHQELIDCACDVVKNDMSYAVTGNVKGKTVTSNVKDSDRKQRHGRAANAANREKKQWKYGALQRDRGDGLNSAS